MSYDKKNYILPFIIIILLPLITGCSFSSKKVPITTTSSKAKELYLKGVDRMERLRNDEAAEYFEKAISIDTGFAMAYLNLALVKPAPAKFLQDFNHALKLKSHVSKGEQLWIEAIEAGINNQLNKQQELFKELVDMYPNDERANYFLASSYYEHQEYSKAIDLFQHTIDINPNYSPSYNLMGYAYRNLKNYTAAEEMFKKYIELIPNDPNPYDSYAELLLEMGEFDKSIVNYEKALKIDPYFYYSYLGIASNLDYKEEHVKARNRLHELLQMARDNNQRRAAINGTALSYFDEGNSTGGLNQYNKLLEISIEDHDTSRIVFDYLMLGIALREYGQLPKAKAMFDTALTISDASSIPEQRKTNFQYEQLINIAQLDIKEHDFESAGEKNEQYRDYGISQGNENMMRFANQIDGMIALEEKEYSVAVEKLLNANQQNPYNLYRLGLAYEGLGDNERAKSFYTKSAETYSLIDFNYAFIRKKAQEKANQF